MQGSLIYIVMPIVIVLALFARGPGGAAAPSSVPDRDENTRRVTSRPTGGKWGMS